MRRHVTYANVAATIALVLAMSGGALAATHYLINSTKQINPKVLKKLRGNAGPRGLQGPQGAPGRTGAPLVSGQTITGSFAAVEPGGEGGHLAASISYPVALAANPTPAVSLYGTSIPGCPGSPAAPTAEPGRLCIYLSSSNNVSFPATLRGTAASGDFRYGVAVMFGKTACKSCEAETYGTWAYTAP